MGKLEKKPTQREKILNYIKRFGSITSWQAYSDLGITQLAARIYELKQLGYGFTTERKEAVNRLGEKTHYDIYRLIKEV